MPLVLDPIQSGYNLSKINENFEKIQGTWDEKLDRVNSGSFYNQMDQALDMNSNPILNVEVDLEDDSSLVNKGYVDAADNALDAKKVDRAGDTMTGQLNTIDPVQPSNATNKRYVDGMIATIDGVEGIVPLVSPRQQGDGVTTVFPTIVTSQHPTSSYSVNLDGVTQRPQTDFTADTNGNVVFTEAPEVGVDIDITVFEPVNLQEAADLSQVTAEGSTETRTLTSWMAQGLVYDTVADMIVNFASEGSFIQTKGYYTVGDNGGALYRVTSSDEGYSIPLNNGLFATLNDKFDIRKLGVISDNTIDQTTELTRVVNYVDAFEYEVDFLNFEIQTPNIPAWTSTNGVEFRGLSFNRDHKIKNLRIKNPQGITLTNGWSCINFTLYNADGGQIILDNVECDPYTSNFTLTPGVGEEDGAMHAVAVRRNRVSGTIPYVSNYGLDISGLNIISPAISYGVHSTIFMDKPINIENVYGQFWGLLFNLYSTKLLNYKNVEAVFRDDIDSGSGRVLVKNAIHCEPELSNITGTVIDCKGFTLKNVSCTKHSDNLAWSAFKVQPVNNSMHILSMTFEDIIGDIQTFASSPTAEDVIDFFSSTRTEGRILLESFRFIDARIEERVLFDTGVTADVYPGRISRTGNTFEELSFKNGEVQNTLRTGNFPLTVGNLNMSGCTTDNGAEGALRNSGTSINLLLIKDHKLRGNKLIEANVNTCFVEDLDIPFGVELRQTFYFRGASDQTMYMKNVISRASNGGSEHFIDFETAGTNTVELNYCRFSATPSIANVNSVTQNYVTP